MIRPNGAGGKVLVHVARMQAWLDRALPDLQAAQFHGDFARGPRLAGRDGASWISLGSPWASGRLVRADDGSSSWSAHRHADGASVLDGRSDTTSLQQLDALAAVVRRDDLAPVAW